MLVLNADCSAQTSPRSRWRTACVGSRRWPCTTLPWTSSASPPSTPVDLCLSGTRCACCSMVDWPWPWSAWAGCTTPRWTPTTTPSSWTGRGQGWWWTGPTVCALQLSAPCTTCLELPSITYWQHYSFCFESWGWSPNSSKICVCCLCMYVLCLQRDWFCRLTWQRVDIYIYIPDQFQSYTLLSGQKHP